MLRFNLGPLTLETSRRKARLALEIVGKGLAFWRKKPDVWAYGLAAIEVDLDDWSWPGIRLGWYNGATPSPGTPWWALHFDWFDFIRVWIFGPLSLRLFYIEDRQN